MRNRKRFLLMAALILSVLFSSLLLMAGADREKYEEKFEKKVALAKDGQVVLSNVSGDIKVSTWDRAEVKIYALKVSRASSASQARENAEEVKIEVFEEGSTLRIETDYPKMGFRSANVSVNYNLTIPAGAGAKVNSVSGSIALAGIGGAAKARSVSGDILLENISGSVKGHSVSGDVSVTKAQRGTDCDAVSGDIRVKDVIGDVFLKTVSGEIMAYSVAGGVDAETVSGNVELEQVSGAKNVKVKALSGSIRYQGSIEQEGRYALTSHSGEITMVIPAESAFNLEAKTFSGGINSDFEIKVTGTIRPKKITGNVNGGGAEVLLNSFSGEIYLRKK